MTNSSIATAHRDTKPEVPIDPDVAWAAVLARDSAYASAFRYGVVTTGIYCKPGCASRTPRRENVRFFGSAMEAEAAGLRPCKRCRPNGDVPSAARRSIERARAYLEAHLDQTVTLEQLARVTHTSAYHLQRTFKRHTGLTPREYVQTQRMARFKTRLRKGDTVSRATYEAGYGSAGRIYDQVDTHLGMTPKTYQNGGDGVRIRFATVATAMGWLLVAATERGVCTVSLGDDPRALEAELRTEYPRADVSREQEAVHEWLESIVAYLKGEARLPSIPLDVQATAFRWRVWKSLQGIPHGATCSYQELAHSIGAPGSARAVARASASNRIALAIPCHRVVRHDGKPSGYRWGVDRKLKLLEMETRPRIVARL